MTRKNIPFCPKCGKKDNIEFINEYLNSWKCSSCSIRFDFSEIRDVDSYYGRIRAQLERSRKTVLDPSRKIVLGPSRRSATGRYGKIDKMKGRKRGNGGNLGSVKI